MRKESVWMREWASMMHTLKVWSNEGKDVCLGIARMMSQLMEWICTMLCCGVYKKTVYDFLYLEMKYSNLVLANAINGSIDLLNKEV